MSITFSLAVFAWIFFRAENLTDAFLYLNGILSISLFSIPTIKPFFLILLIFIFITIEWIGREEQFALAKLGFTWKRSIRQLMYYAIIIAIFWFGGKEQQFIYFQF
jgi:hypothetical protein